MYFKININYRDDSGFESKNNVEYIEVDNINDVYKYIFNRYSDLVNWESLSSLFSEEQKDFLLDNGMNTNRKSDSMFTIEQIKQMLSESKDKNNKKFITFNMNKISYKDISKHDYIVIPSPPTERKSRYFIINLKYVKEVEYIGSRNLDKFYKYIFNKYFHLLDWKEILKSFSNSQLKSLFTNSELKILHDERFDDLTFSIKQMREILRVSKNINITMTEYDSKQNYIIIS